LSLLLLINTHMLHAHMHTHAHAHAHVTCTHYIRLLHLGKALLIPSALELEAAGAPAAARRPGRAPQAVS